MKRTFRSLLLAVIACCCIFSLNSCGGGIAQSEAKEHIEGFLAAIVEEDYTKAQTFLHPERPADLENFFLKVEAEEDIDFQAGIEIKKYTGFSSSLYDGTVDGPTYELTVKTQVGGRTVEFEIEVVRNDNGFGIYNLDIDT